MISTSSTSLFSDLLTVRTKQINKSDDNHVDAEIIHKGISQRQFVRSFTIADDVKVNGAELKDGLLTISCERRFEINSDNIVVGFVSNGCF